MSSVKATEGQWYSDRATHDRFCVIRVDANDGLIDVRDDHGDVDEFDFDEWESMDLVVCGEPKWRQQRLQASAGAQDEDEDGDDESAHNGATG